MHETAYRRVAVCGAVPTTFVLWLGICVSTGRTPAVLPTGRLAANSLAAPASGTGLRVGEKPSARSGRAGVLLPSAPPGQYAVEVAFGSASNGCPAVGLPSRGELPGTAVVETDPSSPRTLGPAPVERPEGRLVAALPSRAPASRPGTPPRIMPLGDSITDGYDVPGGYRVELARQLTGAAASFDFVGFLQNGPSALPDRDHEGHSGWRIDELSHHVGGWLDRARPDVVLLMIGTNDMIQNRDPAGAPARLGRLLDQMFARRPSLRVLVASLPPLADAEQNRRVQAYNAALPALVGSRAAQGRKIGLVDAGAALTLADLADGVHPNPAGYSKLAHVWYEALRRTPGSLGP